jgi:hypothetical protein
MDANVLVPSSGVVITGVAQLRGNENRGRAIPPPTFLDYTSNCNALTDWNMPVASSVSITLGSMA